MTEHKAVYPYSFKESIRNNEHEQWRESYKENCDCARAIERAINEHYSENILHNCIKPLIKQYGFNRVNWVLANTIREGEHDGRYSRENKEWAKKFCVPKDEQFRNYNFALRAHPGLADVFTNLVRKAWQNLGLYEGEQCYPEKLDFKGKIVAIRPDCLRDEFKTALDQLFYAEGGFGCDPNAIGRKVYGRFIKAGDKAWFLRDEIQGVVKLDLLPDWAKAKQAEWSAQLPQEEMGMEETQ